MADDKDRDEARLKDLGAQISVHFDDYLLLVRPRIGSFGWSQSDTTWAYGAAGRYVRHVDDAAMIEKLDEKTGGE